MLASLKESRVFKRSVLYNISLNGYYILSEELNSLGYVYTDEPFFILREGEYRVANYYYTCFEVLTLDGKIGWIWQQKEDIEILSTTHSTRL